MFVNSLKTSANLARRRFATKVTAFPKQPVPEMYQTKTFKDNFLSDPSTYPLIAVMCTACAFVLGMSANALSSYKDIKINPDHKHQIIRDWGDEHVNSMTSILAKNPRAFHAQSFKDIQHEGLGIDHETWKKLKEAERKGQL